MAAYAALGGLRSLVLCPPTASELMRRVMRLHGATVATMAKEARGPLLERLVAEHGWYPVTNEDPDPVGNPFGVAGYKTIAYEIASQLGEVPDSILVPVGSGDCLFGVWRGFGELRTMGLVDRLPRMVGCQTRAAAPLLHALERDLPAVEPLPVGESTATSILAGRCGIYALQCIRDSGGTATAVEENEVADAVRLLARSGLLPEPASAAAMASALALHRLRYFPPGAAVVCVVTGTGVKWPKMVAALAEPGSYLAEPSLAALAEMVKL